MSPALGPEKMKKQSSSQREPDPQLAKDLEREAGDFYQWVLVSHPIKLRSCHTA